MSRYSGDDSAYSQQWRMRDVRRTHAHAWDAADGAVLTLPEGHLGPHTSEVEVTLAVGVYGNGRWAVVAKGGTQSPVYEKVTVNVVGFVLAPAEFCIPGWKWHPTANAMVAAGYAVDTGKRHQMPGLPNTNIEAHVLEWAW